MQTRQRWHDTGEGYSIRYSAWNCGSTNLLLCVPGYTLDEEVFDALACEVDPVWDVIAINPFLHKDLPFDSIEKLAASVRNLIAPMLYKTIVGLGQSLGFRVCMHLMHIAPDLLVHLNVALNPAWSLKHKI